jgi:hypothetical protein
MHDQSVSPCIERAYRYEGGTSSKNPAEKPVFTDYLLLTDTDTNLLFCDGSKTVSFIRLQIALMSPSHCHSYLTF